MKAQVPAQFSPPMRQSDGYLYPQQQYHTERNRPNTPPPLFAYTAYPPPEEMALPHYGAPVQEYRLEEAYPEYLSTTVPVPVTLPAMTHFTDSVKRDPTGYPEASLPSYMGYNGGYLTGGVDMSAGHPAPYDHMPHTPPLSHGYDNSANCSDSGFEYPTTPLSMPGSPSLDQQHMDQHMDQQQSWKRE